MASDKWCASCGAEEIDTDGETINHSWYCFECADVINNPEEYEIVE